jgi:hypothetical protein
VKQEATHSVFFPFLAKGSDETVLAKYSIFSSSAAGFQHYICWKLTKESDTNNLLSVTNCELIIGEAEQIEKHTATREFYASVKFHL